MVEPGGSIIEGSRNPSTRAGPPGWCAAVLGPVRLLFDGVEVPAGQRLTPLQRRLLARLAAEPHRVVPAEQLIDALWPERVPPTARTALHNQISRLRRSIDAGLVITSAEGYRLGIPNDAEISLADLATAEDAQTAGRHTIALELSDAVLERCRDDPLPELLDVVEMHGVRRRLQAIRAAAEMIRLRSAVAVGRHQWAIGEAERLLAERPHDEGCWALLVTALEQVGRRGDALGALGRAGQVVRRDLGLGPSRMLRDLEARILEVDTPLSPAPGLAAFIGRSDEVDHLVDIVGRGGSAVVVGEVGIGRTRLLEQVRRRLHRDGQRVALAQCAPSPGSPVPVLAELAEALGGDPGRWMAPVDGFVSGLMAATGDGSNPVALLVDDAHLAGPSTRLALTRAMALPGVSVILTVETSQAHELVGHDAVSMAGVETVHLAPLDPGEVAAVAVSMLPDHPSLDEQQVRWLMTMSGGNPMMLGELLRVTAEVGWQGGEVPTELFTESGPAALAVLVTQRLRSIGAAATHAVEVAAVAGSGSPRQLVEELSSPAGVAAALAARLLVEEPPGTVSFAQGAVERCVYWSLASGQRAELHHELALLTSGAPIGIRASHALAAAQLDIERAISTGTAAAREATRNGAHPEAARWHERVAQVVTERLGSTHSEALAARIEQAESLRLAGDSAHPELARTCIEEALVLGDAALLARATAAFVQLGQASDNNGELRAATEVVSRVLDRLDGEQWAVVAAAAAVSFSLFGSPEEVRAMFLEAVERARTSTARRLVLPAAYLSLGHVRDLDLKARLGDELLALGLADDDPIAVFEASQIAFSVGLQRADGVGVRRALERMGRLVDATGDVGRRWQYGYCAAAVAHLDGDLARAEQLAADARSVFTPVAPGRAEAAYASQLIMIRLAQDRIGELFPIFEALLTAQPEVAAWSALAAAACTDPERAGVLAAEGLARLPEDFTWLAALTLGARGAAHSGDPVVIGAYLDALSPWSGYVAWQGTCAYGPVDGALALLHSALGADERADEHRHAADALAERLGAPVFRGAPSPR